MFAFTFGHASRKTENGRGIAGRVESLLRQNGADTGSKTGAAALQSGRPAAIAAAPPQPLAHAELAVGPHP